MHHSHAAARCSIEGFKLCNIINPVPTACFVTLLLIFAQTREQIV